MSKQVDESREKIMVKLVTGFPKAKQEKKTNKNNNRHNKHNKRQKRDHWEKLGQKLMKSDLLLPFLVGTFCGHDFSCVGAREHKRCAKGEKNTQTKQTRQL